jgi:hypothetical protein
MLQRLLLLALLAEVKRTFAAKQAAHARALAETNRRQLAELRIRKRVRRRALADGSKGLATPDARPNQAHVPRIARSWPR